MTVWEGDSDRNTTWAGFHSFRLSDSHTFILGVISRTAFNRARVSFICRRFAPVLSRSGVVRWNSEFLSVWLLPAAWNRSCLTNDPAVKYISPSCPSSRPRIHNRVLTGVRWLCNGSEFPPPWPRRFFRKPFERSSLSWDLLFWKLFVQVIWRRGSSFLQKTIFAWKRWLTGRIEKAALKQSDRNGVATLWARLGGGTLKWGCITT